MDGVILPMNGQYREPKAKARDDSWVSTVMTTFLLIESSAPTSIGVYTYSSSNLEEADLQKHPMVNRTSRSEHAYGDSK